MMVVCSVVARYLLAVEGFSMKSAPSDCINAETSVAVESLLNISAVGELSAD